MSLSSTRNIHRWGEGGEEGKSSSVMDERKSEVDASIRGEIVWAIVVMIMIMMSMMMMMMMMTITMMMTMMIMIFHIKFA